MQTSVVSLSAVDVLTLADWTVEQLAWQVLMPRIEGDIAAKDLTKYKPWIENRLGGFILFGGSYKKSLDLIARLQKSSQVPLFVGADLERGLPSQLGEGTHLPPAMGMGAVDDPTAAYRLGSVLGQEASAVGINMVFGPVLDVQTNPDNLIIQTRSFGEVPDKVGRLGYSFANGLYENSVVPCFKHFPGHGSTEEDSHENLPVINKRRRGFEESDWKPYHQCLNQQAAAVMVGHLACPKLDRENPDLPATLSSAVIGQLRSRFGFEGLVITDALGMKALDAFGKEDEVAVKALVAGCDVILHPSAPVKTVNAIVKAVNSGALERVRLEEAVGRILDVKEKHMVGQPYVALPSSPRKMVPVKGLMAKPQEAPKVGEVVGREEQLAVAKSVSARSLTLLRNRGDVLPLPAEDAVVHVLVNDSKDETAGNHLQQALKKRNKKSQLFELNAKTGQGALKKIHKACDGEDYIVIAVVTEVHAGRGRTGLNEVCLQMVRELIREFAEVTVVCLGSPQLLTKISGAEIFLCGYGAGEHVEQAVDKALFGELPVTGHCPVSVVGLLPVGYGEAINPEG